MCNEFNSGLFPSYIWDSFKAEHSAEIIRGRGGNEGDFPCLLSAEKAEIR